MNISKWSIGIVVLLMLLFSLIGLLKRSEPEAVYSVEVVYDARGRSSSLSPPIVFIIVLLLWVATVYSDLTALRSILMTAEFPKRTLLP